MQKFKQSFAVKVLAWVLAVAITVTMTPHALCGICRRVSDRRRHV